MRLHRLRMSAWGPFAGTEEIDLDEATRHGLFLVHGPTGAGKTSILDAICFALFAAVPGSRASGRSLRSDHAPRDARPSVLLEFTAVGRRLRVTRTPEYPRPKKRGTGETSEPATVLLEELRDGEWRVLSSRNDEAAEVIDDVLGMGLAQFSRVVLLPQGDFASFLRASAEDRRRLLERLFDVETYTGVETWLTEQRRRAGQEVADHRHEVRSHLARLRDVVAALPGPVDEVSVPDDDAPADVVRPLLSEVVDGLTAYAARALTRLERAMAEEQDTAAALNRAQARAGHRDKGERALRQQQRVEDEEPSVAAHRERLGAARRALAAAGELRDLDRARARVAAARAGVEHTAAVVAHLGVADRSAAALRSLLDSVRGAGDGLSRAAVLADEAERCRAALEQARHRREEVTIRLADARETRDDTAAQVRRARERLETARAAAAELSAAEAVATRLRASARLRTEVDSLVERLGREESAAERAEGRVHEAREAWLDLREARLAELAGELASRLEDGTPCPVCGSEAHPSPAERSRAVSEDDVEAAETRLEREREASARAARTVASTRSLLTARRSDLGDDGRPATELDRLALEAEEHLEAVRTVAAGADDALDHERSATTRLEQVTADVDELDRAEVTARSDEASAARQLTTDTTAVAEALVDHAATCPCASPHREPSESEDVTPGGNAPEGTALADDDVVVQQARTTHEVHGRREAALAEHLEAVVGLDKAEAEVVRCRSTLDAALRLHDLSDEETAREALLSEDDRARLESAVREHERVQVEARTLLRDPDVVDALSRPSPDVDAVRSAARAAREAAGAAERTRALVERASRDAAVLVDRVSRACVSLARAQERLATVTEMADVVGGAGPHNSYRMRLSTFVLAARLERVVELANERLTAMGEGRFQLRHDDGLAARGARSGLGLRVRDEWTGQERDTATLSGGETFMASLALALGLAEAVREESGGLDLQTLFVDEGFGTLDDESLEDVMAVLDGLRDGGRAVGVVSHVADLRTRIASQVVVSKTPAGSSVRARAVPGRAA